MVANSSSIRRKAAVVLSFCYMLMFAALADLLNPGTENAVPTRLANELCHHPAWPRQIRPQPTAALSWQRSSSADISPCRGSALHCTLLSDGARWPPSDPLDRINTGSVLAKRVAVGECGSGSCHVLGHHRLSVFEETTVVATTPRFVPPVTAPSADANHRLKVVAVERTGR